MKRTILIAALLLNGLTFASKAMGIDRICTSTGLYYRYQHKRSIANLQKGTEVMRYRRVRDKYLVRTTEYGLGYVAQESLCSYE